MDPQGKSNITIIDSKRIEVKRSIDAYLIIYEQ
jgi:hypothetical protein